MSIEQRAALAAFSACDVSDALLKLGVPGAGFLADIHPTAFPGPGDPAFGLKIIAPAFTVLFVPKASPSFPGPLTTPDDLPESNIPAGTPYADLITPDTIVVISQPAGQKCAVVGGIMATRMAKLGARALVVDGRVRDLSCLRGVAQEGGCPVWSRGTSTIGAGAEAKAHAVNVSVRISGMEVRPEDLVMVDQDEKAVVAIPRGRVAEVLELLPGLVKADERVLVDVEGGGSVKEAFQKYRGKL
ncbi:hypothetical protein W97_06307 [Coniosporium apollinis CBS 100218]|uniref:DlpA domain-containing protein n=1 Tax=Coniosporium apollinis (strain CBS 100218) TaxID=1168221 RepID=R7YYN8_CONA1|nr:uncharacterized protein W97_06307 [Coniosporium apollinis CBS 100218]EON66904.1 hypothetical protein W97_06307 [Coniosporium apollinis CBS 100218]